MKISNYTYGEWYSIRCNVEDTHFLNRVLDAAIESGKLNADDKDKAEIIKRFLPVPTSCSKMIDTDGVVSVGYGKIFSHLNHKEATKGKLYCYSDVLYEICEFPERCERSELKKIDNSLGCPLFIDAHNVSHQFCREVETARLKPSQNILEEK